MDDQAVERLKDAGVQYPKVTFFATPEEQRFWQGIDEDRYRQIQSNIENAAKQGLNVFVNNVLWKSNIGSIESLAEQCYDMGAKRIKFIRFIGPKWNNEFITDEDMDEVVERIENAKMGRAPRLQVSFAFAGPNFYGKSLEEARAQLPPQEGEWVKSNFMCPSVDQNYWGISLKRGEVYWCYFLKDDPSARIGTVDSSGKVTISTTTDLRPETLKKELKGKCSADSCEYQPVCLGGCRRTAYLASGWKGKPDLYAEMDTCLTRVSERVFRE